tara:strand:+ start:1055 stop:1387 length:333 start_codon:yes stop_codon:yes gene_type:complete
VKKLIKLLFGIVLNKNRSKIKPFKINKMKINKNEDIGGLKELILWTLKAHGFNYKDVDGYYIGLEYITVKVNTTIISICATASPPTQWHITDVRNLAGNISVGNRYSGGN